jgi:ATP-binding cassette subfamily G (WHITE) protein 2 (SNQ2)
MSHPDNLQRLESLTRVLSSRRLSVASGGPGTLAIDPDDFDLSILLKTIRKRFDEQGMAAKYSGVAFKNLTVNGVDVSTSYGPSVGEIFHNLVNLPSVIKNTFHPPTRPIIRNAHGIANNGEMVLVLGRPGSGCSTLLKTLAGEISQFTSVDGDISYDGATLEDMLAHFKSEIIYNPERMFPPFFTVADVILTSSSFLKLMFISLT